MNCPTPWKVWYETRNLAKSQAARATRGLLPSKNGQLRPYRCECGGWHLTAISKNELRRVKKRQRARAA